MTHGGQVVTFSAALPALIRIARQRKTMRLVLACAGADHLHPVPDSCRDVPDLDWSHCPLDLLDSPMFGASNLLSKLADVSPVDGWPTKYAAWAVAGVLAIREARA